MFWKIMLGKQYDSVSTIKCNVLGIKACQAGLWKHNDSLSKFAFLSC